MRENDKYLLDILKNIERLKVGIMKQVNEANYNKASAFPTTVYPMAKVQPMVINDYPVFQFSYEGMLPHYKRTDKEYNKIIKDYYFRSTIDAYDFEQINIRLDEAVIIYVQYFRDDIIQDLDNRNKKYIQDAIRQTTILVDDSWKNVWNMDIGFKDEEANHVQVYVVPKENYMDFYSYLMENHEEIKNISDQFLTQEQYFLEYQERIKDKDDDIKLNLTEEERRFLFDWKNRYKYHE